MKTRSLILLCAFVLLVPTLALAQESSLTNWAKGASYLYSMAPNETYPDDGGQLTDGVYGQAVFSDPAWVGNLRNDFRMITLDLGQVRSLQEIRANFLHQVSVGIYYPQEVIAEVSTDGVLWEEVGFQVFQPHRMDSSSGVSQPAVFAGFDAEARYVRLTFLVDVWVFIDEIEALGK